MKKSSVSMVTHLEHCEDLLQCVYNLTPNEVQIYRLLLLEGPMTANDVGDRIGRSANTAYRFLRSLQACKLVYKKHTNRKEGGYFYLYYPEEPDNVRERLRDFKDQWDEKIEELIKEFPRDIPKGTRLVERVD